MWAARTPAQDILRTNRNAPRTERTPTPTRTPRTRTPRPRVVEPLALQWWLLRFDDKWRSKSVGLSQVSNGAISINETFSQKDYLRLAVKAEQDGYLYVIHQPSGGGDGRLLFPNKNGGDNYVRKGREFYLPDCSGSPEPWLTLPSPGASETVRLILSRERIREFATDGQTPVRAHLIDRLLKAHPQELTYSLLYPNFAKVSQKAGGSNGSRIIETLTINGAGAGKSAGAPAAKN